MNDETRKLPELDVFQQHIYDTYTELRPSHPDNEYKHGTLWLKVDVQSFRVTDIEFEDAIHAEWFRRLLAKALANMSGTIVDTALSTAAEVGILKIDDAFLLRKQ